MDHVVAPPHEVLVNGRHGPSHAAGIGGAREDAPRLRDRRDGASIAAGGAEGRAVVEIRATVPVAIPCFSLERLLDGPGMGGPSVGALCLAASRRDRSPFCEDRVQEPGEPHALPLALDAYAIHSVVPVPGSHQRQAVDSNAETAI